MEDFPLLPVLAIIGDFVKCKKAYVRFNRARFGKKRIALNFHSGIFYDAIGIAKIFFAMFAQNISEARFVERRIVSNRIERRL